MSVRPGHVLGRGEARHPTVGLTTSGSKTPMPGLGLTRTLVVVALPRLVSTMSAVTPREDRSGCSDSVWRR